MKYRLDPSWWRHSRPAGETVVAGTPTRIFRFASSAKAFLDDIEAGRDLDESTRTLQSRLVDSGAIHPVAAGTSPVDLQDVTVLIPARVDDPTPVESLVNVLGTVATVMVVDDGSPTRLEKLAHARIERHDVSRGPAAARNRALDVVDTPFVLFLDHDIELPDEAASSEFWQPLLFHMSDPRTVIVAPRVCSVPGSSVRERYEVEHSPLDMGPTPARVAPGARISYVPSAALLVRMDALRSLRGFDDNLRYGEDVDLVWRANEAGFVCRYEPAVVVHHRPRGSWRELLVQRFRYGTAAAPLEARHAGATRPVRMNKWSAIAIVTALLGHPVIALVVACSTIARLARRLGSIPDRWMVAVRLAGRGHVYAVRSVLESSMRTWWPITLVVCIVSHRIRSVVTVFLAVRSTTPILRRILPGAKASIDHGANAFDDLDPARSACARVGDDFAYGAGVWWSTIDSRDVRCLVPKVD